MLSRAIGPRNAEFRFTLRGLMILIVFAALGSALVRNDLSRWHDGLLVVVVGWFVLGIGNQICDLLRASGRLENSSWNVRGTIVLELVRRVMLSLVLVGYLAWIVLGSPDAPSDNIYHRWAIPEALFLLAMMSGLLLSTPPRDIVLGGSARILRDVILAGVCGVWLFYLYRDWLEIHEAVQRGVRGVLSRLRFIDVGMSDDAHDMWVRDCAQSAIIAAVAVVLAIVFTKTLVRRWNGGQPREWLWILPLGLSLAVAGWEVSWAASTGLPNVEFYWFYFGEALSWPGAVILFKGGIVLLLFVTEATLRVGQVRVSDSNPGIQWRLRPRSYAHERQATLVLLVVTVIGWLVSDLYWRGVESGLIEFRPSAWRTLQASLPRLMADSATVLKVACVLMAIHVLWWQWISSPHAADAPTAPIRLLKFCVVWVAILATTVLTTAALLWLYYTVYLMPR
jgi:hypothetical protein